MQTTTVSVARTLRRSQMKPAPEKGDNQYSGAAGCSDQSGHLRAVGSVHPFWGLRANPACTNRIARWGRPLGQKKNEGWASATSGLRVDFAFLSARVGSIGDNRLGGWISYRAAKAAQNQIIRTAAIEIARTNRQAIIVALHPGTVDTDLSQPFSKGRDRFTPDQSAARLLETINGLDQSQTGQFFAYDGSTIEW